MGLSLAQRKALAIAPKCSGLMSMCGSFLIIRDVLTPSESTTAKKSTYHRLLFGMSCVDIFVSFWYFLSTWPVPRGTAGVWGAVGTTATCTMQGCLGQIGVATPMYNASLALYYYFVAVLKWDDEKLQRAEKWLHAVPLTVGVGTSIAGLPLKLYNNANLWCWIAGYPLGCKETFEHGDDGDCERGDNSWVYRLAFWYAPIWLVIIIATGAMAGVYCAVLKRERAVDEYQADGVSLRSQSRRVAVQATCYLFVFYFTFTPTTVARILQFMQVRLPFSLLFLVALLNPWQGFLNFLVYTRTRYVQYRRAHPRSTVAEAVRQAAFSSRNKKSTVTPPAEDTGKKGSEMSAGAKRLTAPSSVIREDMSSSEEGDHEEMDGQECTKEPGEESAIPESGSPPK